MLCFLKQYIDYIEMIEINFNAREYNVVFSKTIHQYLINTYFHVWVALISIRIESIGIVYVLDWHWYWEMIKRRQWHNVSLFQLKMAYCCWVSIIVWAKVSDLVGAGMLITIFANYTTKVWSWKTELSFSFNVISLLRFCDKD